METDEGVKDYVKEKVRRLQKFVENPREAHVVLATEKFRHMAEITIIGDRGTLNSQGKDSDLYAAIDQMVDKMERQIRGRKGKGRRKRSNAPGSKAPSLVEGSAPAATEEAELSSVTRRRRALAKPMSVDEAVAQLQLSEQDLLFFINSDSGQVNALYRHQDGGYEWVEPSSQ
jgi:putative sigma-54 modulation protein